jgi:uncharacterized membrane protein
MFRDWDKIVPGCLQGNDKVATLDCIPAIFLNVVSALLAFVGFFALFLFIFAGWKYMNSGGDPKKLEGARNTLIYGILGLLVVLFSFFIIGLISTVTHTPCVVKFGFGCQ